MRRSLGMRLRVLWVLALVAAGCAAPRTAVLVVVESDLAVPAELGSVHADVGSTGHDFSLGVGGVALPFSFVLEPRNGDPTSTSTLTIEGRDAGGVVLVTRRVRVAFAAQRTVLLRVRLERACLARTCAAGLTCVGGACVDDRVDVDSLSNAVPGRELEGLDAAVARGDATVDLGPDLVDASAPDAPDTGPGDAARDAGGLPRSCRDVAAGLPSGAYELDPPGATRPLRAYCELVSEGGGWTLLAKLDPATTRLAFAAPEWTAATSASAFGTVDLAPGDALLAAYWDVPVRALRVVMTDGNGTRSLVASMIAPTASPLRAMMTSATPLTLTTPLAEWARLTGSTPPSSPPCAASAMPLDRVGVRLRLGAIAGNSADCAPIVWWAGLGAEVTQSSGPCRPSTISAGSATLCSPGRGAQPSATLLFGR